MFLAGLATPQQTLGPTPAKRSRRTKTTNYRDHFIPEDTVSPEHLLASNLEKQSSSLTTQAEILQLEKQKAECSLEKERNLLEMSKIDLQKAEKIAEMEVKHKEELIKNEQKHQLELFELEMKAKKRDLNLETK